MTFLEYITPSRIGGAETYFIRMVEHLARQGHRVIVVTKRDAALRHELERKLAGLPNVRIHGWLTRGKLDPRTFFRLCRLIRREKVDVVHTHLTTASWIGSMAGRACRVPVVCHVHAADAKTYFQFGHYLVAVAHGVRRHLLDQGVPGDKIPVLYYGVDLARYSRPLPPEVARKKLGLPPELPCVGVVASLQERKGHRFLLEAMAGLQARGRNLQAIFAGEGPEEGALREQARGLGLEHQVHFLGFTDDVNTVVSACDIVALPSRKEGLSIAVMEAMALERPVIATSIAGMPELVQEGVSGLLVPPFETPPLQNALETLLADEERRRAMALAGREILEQQFDQVVCLARLENFLVAVARAWQNGKVLNAAEWAEASEPSV